MWMCLWELNLLSGKSHGGRLSKYFKTKPVREMLFPTHRRLRCLFFYLETCIIHLIYFFKKGMLLFRPWENELPPKNVIQPQEVTTSQWALSAQVCKRRVSSDKVLDAKICPNLYANLTLGRRWVMSWKSIWYLLFHLLLVHDLYIDYSTTNSVFLHVGSHNTAIFHLWCAVWLFPWSPDARHFVGDAYTEHIV